jgi:hypothetical protein
METAATREGYPLPDCPAVWAKHRKRLHFLVGLWVGWVPFGVLVTMGLRRLGILPWAPVFVVLYMLAIIVAAILWGTFRCPRCGHKFYARGPFGLLQNKLARKCRNCGLRKYQCKKVNGE